MMIATSHAHAAGFRAWGLETLDSIQKELLLPDGKLYGEEARPGEAPKNPAFDWSVGVTLEALAVSARLDGSLKPRLKSFVEATQVYWNPAGPVPGFDVLPMPKPVDRYYDDNQWMVTGLVEASTTLDSKLALEYAKKTFDYVWSGEDAKLGGGIYWRESDKSSKNTCSNGPAASAALSLYDLTHEPSYLQKAEDLYAWTKQNLRDPADGLYWDSMSLNGHIGKAKWSYNSGLMLRAAADLYRITKRREYREDAIELQASSLKHWVSPEGYLKDDGKFVHLLLENWLRAFREVPGVADPRPAITQGLTLLHDQCRDSLGHYPNRWDQRMEGKTVSPFKLIDEASAARAYLIAAEAGL